ncbi:hypothetical protein DRO58_04040 [Candidatus Bathyarchaeota archaeon]|nr:MAG: hypothetical protein DRO58_04040 [Candidatus Bathyarchaeota archaeon]
MVGERVDGKVTVKTLLWVATLSIAMTVICNFFVFWLPPIASCTQNVGNLIPTPGIDLMGWPFATVLIATVLKRIPFMRKRLTMENLTYLYIASLAVSYFANFDMPWGMHFGFLITRWVTPETTTRYIPEFVSIPKEVVTLLVQGAGSITALPWDTLLPAIIWWFLFVALFGGISIGLANIFRREWIDVEMLPFPQITIAYSTITGLENVGKPKWYGRTPFILGILAGILLAIPVSGTALFPWFPNLYDWRVWQTTCGPGCHWIAPPDLPWNLGIPKHAPVYALLLLVPVHLLFSIVFYTMVLEAAIFISYYTGYYTGYTQLGFCGRTWCASSSPYGLPPLHFSSLVTGCALGLFVITIFLEKSYIIETLKMAFGSMKAKELEVGEPMSYRASWIILIASFTLLMMLLMSTGCSPWISFTLVLGGFMSWFITVQLWARLGFSDTPVYSYTPGLIKLFAWPTEYSPPITSVEAPLAMIVSWHAGAMASSGWGGSLYTLLGGYRMAKLTGVNPRNVLKVAVVSLLVAMFFSHITAIMISGVFGGSRTHSRVFQQTDIESWVMWNFWPRPAASSMIELTPWLATGFVLMTVVRYLCTRFLWLPDPLTTLVAWGWIASLHGVWFAALVCYIVKTIVLKIGGSRLYEEQVIPFVGGFILGDALDVLLTGIASFILFPPTL